MSDARRTERVLSRKEAANYLTELGLTISAQTLARLFSEGKGPMCMKFGWRAKYKESDLLAYLRTQASAPRQSSSEPLRPIGPDDLPIPANDPHAANARAKPPAQPAPHFDPNRHIRRT